MSAAEQSFVQLLPTPFSADCLWGLIQAIIVMWLYTILSNMS